MNTYLEIILSLAPKNKYTKIYVSLCEKAVTRARTKQEFKLLTNNQYCESHHILPKCFKLGGESDPENRSIFTAKEHFVAHRLLTKMFLGELGHKMV